MNEPAISLEPETETETIPPEVAGIDDDSWRITLGPRLLVVAVVVWLWSLNDIDPRAMTDVGLLSVLPSTFFIALAVLTVGFLFVLEHQSHDRRLVGGYLITLSALAHATPALLYGTVRYSWSYQHLGMVDYVQRGGELDPDATFLQIHHSWPGVFAATAMVADITGIEPSTIAIWAPFCFSIVSMLALSIVFRSFVADQRVVWLGVWLFVLANWVGQEYFSPQGLAYALYLSLLAIAIPFHRIDGASDTKRFWLSDSGDLAPTTKAPHRVAVSCLIVILLVAITATHQLTPIVVVLTFGVIAAFRVSRTAWVAVAGVALMLVWIAGPALTYVRDHALGGNDELGSPAETSGAAAFDNARRSTGQAIVLITDRFLTEAMLVLAIIGLVMLWRRRQGGVLIAALLVAPVALLPTGFGAEMLFRSYLYSVPWIALCGAVALIAITDDRTAAVRLATRAAVITILLVAFLFAYLGKERANYFTDEEVDLAAWVGKNAPANTQLIEGSQNYPGNAVNYENFAYLPISGRPEASLLQLDADPEETLYQWMTNERYVTTYLILTRSMKLEQASAPSLPEGMLDRIEAALRTSDRFRILRSNDDGAVWIAVENQP